MSVSGVTHVESHCRIASWTLPMIENDGFEDVPSRNGISLRERHYQTYSTGQFP